MAPAAVWGTRMGMCCRVARWAVEAVPQAWQLPQGPHSLSPAAHQIDLAWWSMVAVGVAIPACRACAGCGRAASRPKTETLLTSEVSFQRLLRDISASSGKIPPPHSDSGSVTAAQSAASALASSPQRDRVRWKEPQTSTMLERGWKEVSLQQQSGCSASPAL